MLPARVRLASTVFVGLAAIACSDTSGPSATRPESLSKALASATVRVLPGLDGFVPTAINDSDEVVGYTNADIPFKWTPAGGLVMLSHGSFVGALPLAVNDHGVIVGTAVTSTIVVAASNGALWDSAGAFRALGDPPDSVGIDGANECEASGINVWGHAVGTCVIPHGPYPWGIVNFDWHKTATTAGGELQAFSQFTSVSDDNWIGGDLNGQGIPQAPIVVSPTGQVIELLGHDAAIHDYSVVTAVTRNGYSAGYSTEGNCQQAVAWLSHTGQTFPEFRWGTCGQSTGITPDQYVSGTGSDANLDASTFFAFVASPTIGMHHLPGLGQTGETSTAVAINTRHHVLGTITSASVTQVVIWNVTQ